MYVEEGYKYLNNNDKQEYVNTLKKLCSKVNFKPKRYSLTYDMLHGKPIFEFKYKLARSIRKRAAMFGFAKIN